MSNSIKVLFFANLRTLVGVNEVYLEIPPHTRVADVKRLVTSKYPELADAIKTSLVSINREFAFDDDLIPECAEIAIFPPVSGGVDDENKSICFIVREMIDINQIILELTSQTDGAIVLFTGLVRGVTIYDETRVTEYLDYEAYEPMALEKMKQIIDEIRTKCSDAQAIPFLRRMGVIKPGEKGVVIDCSSPPRDSGVFAAARYGIDRLKEIVPVWKKEVGPTGEEWIEGTYIPKADE